MLIHLGFIIYKNMFLEFQECSDFPNNNKRKQNIDTQIFTLKSNICMFLLKLWGILTYTERTSIFHFSFHV